MAAFHIRPKQNSGSTRARGKGAFKLPQSPGTGVKPHRAYNLKDARGVVGAQNDINQWTAAQNAKMNRVNQVGPFGSQKWSQDANGNWTMTTDLGGQQGLYDQQLSRDTGLGDIAKSQMGRIQGQGAYDLSGIGNDPTKFNFADQRKAIEDQIYKRFADINEPRFQQEEQDFDQKMADRGIPVGSAQYNTMKMEMERQHNDARQAAQVGAIQTGQGEEAQAFNQGMQARQQGVQEYGQQRGAPWQDMANAIGMQKGLMVPQFQGIRDYGQVDQANTDVSGAIAATKPVSMGGGGGGGGAAPFNLATDPAYQRWLAQQTWLQQNGPKGPSTGQQIGGMVGNVLGTAGGIALGSYLGG